MTTLGNSNTSSGFKPRKASFQDNPIVPIGDMMWPYMAFAYFLVNRRVLYITEYSNRKHWFF